MATYSYRTLMRQATPRNGALLDTAYGFKGISGGTYAGGGSSFNGYWDLITTDPSGNDLPESAWYIATRYHAMSEGGLSAYGINPNAPGGTGTGPGGGGLSDFQITGSGNAIASVTGTNGSTVVGTLGWFYNAVSLSGTGTVLTGVSASNGTLTFTRGTAGGGAVSQVQQYYGPSLTLNTTVTSNAVIRCGYLNGLSGTVANNSYSDAGICWGVSSSNCLGLAATIQRPNYDIGGITLTWRWQGAGLQFTIHNRSGSSLSLSDISVSFVAICTL